MACIGNCLFHWRNVLFPAGYLLLFITGSDRLLTSDYFWPTIIGLGIAVVGQTLRFVTIGLDYIVRGGRIMSLCQASGHDRPVAHCRNRLSMSATT